MCCFWIFCSSCMRPSRFTWRDAQIIGWLLQQFMILGPLMACLLTIAQLRQLDAQEISTTMNIANFVSLWSLLLCVYGLNVLIGVAESCAHVSEQRPAVAPQCFKPEDSPEQQRSALAPEDSPAQHTKLEDSPAQ